jgi:hypothetical protein
VVEVNGLSEFGVKVEVERSYSRAPITGVMLGWWRKTGEDYRATYQGRQRPKLGRVARLKGAVEAATLPGADGEIARRDADRSLMAQTSSV